MIKAVIFDLDGVIVSTDEFHYQAWKKIAEEERIYFNREINQRLRGVSRMESLEIILERADRLYCEMEKRILTEKKNDLYKEMLQRIGPKDILPGVVDVLSALKKCTIKVAIGSSSKNTRFILEQIGLTNQFDAIADGNDITKCKPDPEVFQLAASLLCVAPEECIVVEDAYVGVDAGKAMGSLVLAVGFASSYDKADYVATDLESIDIERIIQEEK